MRLKILQVPDCPNVAVLRRNLDEALSGLGTNAKITVHVIADDDEAAAAGMTGSPTLLVDGVDPFAESGRCPSMSCRLYRDASGRTSGAPSVTALSEALHRIAGDGSGACCAPAGPCDRGGPARPPANPAERAVH